MGWETENERPSGRVPDSTSSPPRSFGGGDGMGNAEDSRSVGRLLALIVLARNNGLGGLLLLFKKRYYSTTYGMVGTPLRT